MFERLQNKDFVVGLLDHYLTIDYLLSQFDATEYTYNHSNSIFCPFHDNTNTPAARIYPNSSGTGEHIFCHSEQRAYYPHDFFLEYSGLLRHSIYAVGALLWGKLSPSEQEAFLVTSAVELPEKVVALDNAYYAKYRSGAVTLTTVVEEFLRLNTR